MTDNRTPPQSLEAERAVLGGILMIETVPAEVAALLQPQDFYSPLHADIYRAALELNGAGTPVTLVTLDEYFKSCSRTDISRADLTKLTDDAMPESMEIHAKIVAEKTRQRRAITLLNDAEANLSSDRLDGTGVTGRLGKLQQELATLIAATTGDRSNGLAPGAQEHDGLIFRNLVDIEARSVSWLWPGRIPCGKLSIIAGHPGLGKSQLCVAIAATVTRGGTWPNSAAKSARGGVILLSAEDDAEDTIRPRLEAAGADLTRAWILDGTRTTDGTGSIRLFDLNTDLPRLKSWIKKLEGVSTVIIDPLTAYCGDIDSHKTAEVRALLARISELAAQTNVAIIGVSHLTKNQTVEAMMRITGNHAFVAAARAVFLVAKDNEDETKRLFLPVKTNLSKDPTGLAFRLEERRVAGAIASSRIVWDADVVTITADEIMAAAQSGDRNQTAEAVEWLKGRLADGACIAGKVQKEAREVGITDKCLRTARERLGVKTEKMGMGGGWVWKLPAEDAQVLPEVAQEAIRGQEGIFGPEGHLRDQDEAWEKVL